MPPITSCLFDQPRQKFHCVNPEGKSFDLIPSDQKSDKLVCIPFQDFSIVLNYCESLKSP